MLTYFALVVVFSPLVIIPVVVKFTELSEIHCR